MARDVVERCRSVLKAHRQGNVNASLRDEDLEVVLAVVEAAKDLHRELVGLELDAQQSFHFSDLGEKLARLYAGSSGETRVN